MSANVNHLSLVVDFGTGFAAVVLAMVTATVITFEVHNRCRLSIAVCSNLIARARLHRGMQGATLKGGVNHRPLQLGSSAPSSG